MDLPEYFVSGYFTAGGDQLSPEKRHGNQKPGEHFAIDDLLDFSNVDKIMSDGFFDNAAGNSTDSSIVTAVDSCNSSIFGGDNHFSGNIVSSGGFTSDPQFSGELYLPYEDMAELEWLSNFVEETFPVEDELKTLHLITGGMKSQMPESSSSSDIRNAPFFHPETPLPGKARSKRSRPASGDWSTRLVHLIKQGEPKPVQAEATKKRDGPNSEPSGRKCKHCAAEKTPQWRTGPMGPKSLCNACGVRYKSGRLVPEYRPAASPTFVSTKHSNSHRKVVELRRQKELQRHQQHQHLLSRSSVFGVSNGGDAYLIPHHSGPDFGHII